MKKILLALVLLVSGLSASALNPFLEIQPVISGGGTTSFNAQVGLNQGLIAGFSVGAGVGVTEQWNFDNGPLIPIFVRGQYNMALPVVKPFISMDLGYEVNTDNTKYGAVLVNPMIGLKFTKFYAAVGYLGHCWTPSGAGTTSCFNVKLGINF